MERDILQLPLDLLHAEPVRQRRIDLHGLHGLGHLLCRGLVFEGAHIVQPVRDLDEDNADVLAHGHEHLAQILHLLLFHCGILDAGQLGDTLDQLGHRPAEQARDLVEARIRVLHDLVEQLLVEVGVVVGHLVPADLGHDLRHGQRMDDIGFAGFAQLHFMFFVGVFKRALYYIQIGGGRIPLYRLHHGFIMFFSGFHSVSCLLHFQMP